MFDVCKQTFHIFHVRISQNVKGVLMWNLRYIVFMLSEDIQKLSLRKFV